MLLAWIFYLPMAIAGVPPVVFVAVGLIDLLYQFWIHTETRQAGSAGSITCSLRPRTIACITASTTQYLDKNYGGILILWDRLFGTFEEEVETPVFGVRGGLEDLRSRRREHFLLRDHGRPLPAGERLARQD